MTLITCCLRQASRGVMEVLFFTVARLAPLDDARIHDQLVCRIVSTLTHQNMLLGMEQLPAGGAGGGRATSASIMRTSNAAAGMMRSQLADRLLAFFAQLTRHFQGAIHEGTMRRSMRAMEVRDSKQRRDADAERATSSNASSNNCVSSSSLLNGSRQQHPLKYHFLNMACIVISSIMS